MRWLCLFTLVAAASAQIPSLGWCPDYSPMERFNMNRFLGSWYEAERYFTVSELGSRCVTTKYDSTPEGRILVSNEITNSITGLKRIMDGSLQMIGSEGEGRVIVKYSSFPVPYDTEYSILGTDYDNYAVIWSCSGIGPVHTQNAWVMTRERLPPVAVMQAAYGVLDKYKISRTFFVKTNQADCGILPLPVDSVYETKSAGGVENVALKHADVVPEVPEKVVEQAVEHKDEAELKSAVKSNVVQERVAVPSPAEEPAKPMPVPELIMAESAEKEVKKSKPEEAKPEQAPEIPAPSDLKEPEKKE